MKILFVASEVAPYVKTGGLADVAGALPKELKRLGHDVRIILPDYRTIDHGAFSIRRTGFSATIDVGGKLLTGVMGETSLEGIPVYLVGNERFFAREYLYGTPTGDYPDNPLRFAFFCRWVLEFLGKTEFCPDSIHCHDWQTALIPILLGADAGSYPHLSNSAVLYTIHNLGYQGLFPAESLSEMGLAASGLAIDSLEFHGKVNLMKGAILTADLINTVSEGYCREIQTPEMGCGLDGILKRRQAELCGILNGLDYGEWDPATDREILRNYSAENLAGKRANKEELQRLLGLEQSADIPLVGIVSRLSAQKGFDLIARLLSRFARHNLQLVVLGAGDDTYIRLLGNVKTANFSFNPGFDTALAHKIYAGCDMFLMPSAYEPCGLGQMISLRYGTVPVVRKTGGLADTVRDERDDPGATGFSFTPYSSAALWGTICRALQAWHDREKWAEIVRRGMTGNFSWDHAAQQYLGLYRRAVETKRG